MAQEHTQKDDQNTQQGDAEQVAQVSGGLVGEINEYDSIAPQLPQRMNPATKSTPIAIVRDSFTRDNNPDTSDDDDDEYDDSVIDVDLDALRIARAKTSRSLPGRLLRAPFLGSMPSNEDYIFYQDMLPPAMALSEQPAEGGPVAATDKGTSYGSLRDSHMRGRFFDGPSSYRDKLTGDIRSTQHRVRFKENTTVSSSAPTHSMSIGERIRQSREQQANRLVQKATQDCTSSSLSSMLEGTDDGENVSTASGPPVNQQSVTFYEEDAESQLDSNMLSTSLTGLEVLQSAELFQVDQARANYVGLKDIVHQSLNINSNNTGPLARSLTDPIMPQFRHSNLATAAADPSQATIGASAFLSQSSVPPPLAPSIHFASSAPVTSPVNAYPFQSELEQSGAENSDTLDQNPDTEGAFDMDME
jgi:hypothetical protein